MKEVVSEVDTEDDEDEFKSAESKTPPKEKFQLAQSATITTPKATIVTSNNQNDSEIVTEQSSDGEFEVTRPVTATATAQATPSTKQSQTAMIKPTKH